MLHSTPRPGRFITGPSALTLAFVLFVIPGCDAGTGPAEEPGSEEMPGLCSLDDDCAPPEHLVVDCAGELTPLPTEIGATLRSSDSPYLLAGEVSAVDLRVQPGVVVCGEEGAELVVGTLRGAGTPEEPVVFTALDAARPWGGITARAYYAAPGSEASLGRVHLSRAVVQYAEVGVSAPHIGLTGVRFRQIEGVAIAGAGTIRDVVVDTACASSSCDAAVGLLGRVTKGDQRESELTRVTIRGSGGHGLEVGAPGMVTATDLTILDPRGSGIVMDYWMDQFAHRSSLELNGSTVIEGEGGYLIDGWARTVTTFLRARADSTLAADSVRLAHFCGYTGAILVPAGLTVRTYNAALSYVPEACGIDQVPFGGLAVLRGGAFEHAGIVTAVFDSIRLAGTADAPARLVLDSYWPTRADALVVEHGRLTIKKLDVEGGEARLSDAEIRAASGVGREPFGLALAAPGAVVERTRMDGVGLALDGEGSRVADAVIDGSPGHGITIGADGVQVEGCVITGSAGDGVHVSSGAGIAVNRCDLASNVGAGVSNETADAVDARGNWWGDPAGPDGPDGDGVEGAVDAGDPLAAPVAEAPAYVRVITSADTVATADTVRFRIEAYDADDRPITASGFTLELPDGRLDRPDAGDPGLALALEAGEARVRAASRGYPGVVDTLVIEVVTGAPLLDWERVDTEIWSKILPLSPTRFVTAPWDPLDSQDPALVRLWDDGAITDTWIAVDAPEFGVRSVTGTALDDLWASISTNDGNTGTPDPWFLVHWDGEAWTVAEELSGRINAIWPVSPFRLFVLWEDGMREWRDGTWSDVWTPGSATDLGRDCNELAVGSATHAYAICTGPDAPGARRILRFDGVGWSQADLPPVPDDLDAAIVVLRPSDPPALVADQGVAVLQDGAWRVRPRPSVGLRGWAPMNDGGFLLGGSLDYRSDSPPRTLWYLSADARWQGVWLPPDIRPLVVWGFASVDDALFVGSNEGLYRATPR